MFPQGVASRTHARGVTCRKTAELPKSDSCIPHARARSDLRIASQQMRKLRTCAHPRAYRPLTPKRGGRTNFLLRVRDFFDRREMITLAEYLPKKFCHSHAARLPCHVNLQTSRKRFRNV